MDFNLNNYKVFYEVAKCKNITKASNNLYISQPAISQVIKKLEEDLDCVLFVRSKKGMELTAIGEKIFKQVETSLNALNIISELISKEKGLLIGELNIASGSNIARKTICNALSIFIKNHPLVNVSVKEMVQSKMIDMLTAGKLQIAITQKNEEINHAFIPLLTTNYIFVKSKNCSDEKFILISEGSFTNIIFKNFIEENNLSHIPTIDVAGYKTALELAKLGVGTILVPEYLASEEIKKGNLKQVYTSYKLPTITFGAYYNQDLLTPATNEFLKYLNNTINGQLLR